MLPRQLKEIALTSGISTKGDHRAQLEQDLDIATNVEFDDIGGLRCRYPFDAVRTNILGGGTISGARKIDVLGNELLLWTSDTLYTWSAIDAAWISRGTHLAIAVDEKERFPTPADTPQCDRATLSGRTLYTWTDGSTVWVAAIDATTGAVVVPPTSLGVVAFDSPRVTALATKFLLTYRGILGKLFAVAIGPATIVADLTGGATASFTAQMAYDIAKVPNADAAILVYDSAANHYTAVRITSTATTTSSVKARTSTGMIAVSVAPDSLHAQVSRVNGANIEGDLLDATTLADVFTAQAIGTAPSVAIHKVASAYRSVQSSAHYRCYVFWTSLEDVTGGWQSQSNWVDDANNLGTAAVFVRDLSIAARPFDVGGRVFVWTVFAGGFGLSLGLQNLMLLYRDDAFLCAKGLDGTAAGFLPDPITGLVGPQFATLPNVESLGNGQYACLATERRIVPVTGGSTYTARAPRDLVVTFDSNTARRAARLGDTLYIASGEVLAYDGVQLVEVGWHVYPWQLTVTPGAAGNLPNGAYTYKSTVRWDNGRGERDRSTTVLTKSATVAAGPKLVTVSALVPNYTTHKSIAAVEVWRTAVNPDATFPFFLITSTDPTATGANGYQVNDPTLDNIPAFTDNLPDATLTTKAANPETGTVLERISPTAAKIIYASDTRLFLAGIPGFPNQVLYSKLRETGLVAGFNDQLTFDVPADGGAITAIGELDGALVVWCETATYQFAGSGLDNTGAGSNFVLARVLSDDLGCVGPEGCALSDDGFFVKTGKGWYVLGRAMTYQYVGGDVATYDGEVVLATVVLTARHQVRILTTARMLVFDTLVRQWAETSVNDGLDLVVWNGQPAYLTATGVRAELATWSGYAGTDYTLTAIDVETGWAKFGAMQARAIVDYVQLLGELRSTCVIRKRLARNYEAASPGVWNYTTDVTWTPSPGVFGSAFQVRQAPRRKRCEAIKARFTITAPDGVSPLGGPCVRLTSIAILFALEPNAFGALGAAQKQ